MVEKSKTDEVLMPEKREVYVGEEKFEIGPLVRAKYQKLIYVFVELVINLDDEILDNAEENIGQLISVVSEDALMQLYEVVLEKDQEWINNNMLMNQELELFRAIIELNDIESLVENFTRTLKLVKPLKNKFQSSK